MMKAENGGRCRNERTNTIAVCVEHANLLAVYHLIKLLDLLVLGRLIVILLCDRRVGLGVDLARLELVRHSEGMCSREVSGSN
jgi:hypothetical protein